MKHTCNPDKTFFTDFVNMPAIQKQCMIYFEKRSKISIVRNKQKLYMLAITTVSLRYLPNQKMKMSKQQSTVVFAMVTSTS